MTIDEILAAMQPIADAAETRSLSNEEIETYEGLEKQLAEARRSEEIRSRHTAYTAPRGGLQINTKAATGGEESLERAFDNYLRTGQPNQDIAELRAQNVLNGAAGGYTVPDGFRQKLVDRMKAFGGLQNVCETITTSDGNSLEWPTLDDTSGTAEIVAEGAAAASAGADLVFGTKALGAYKYESTGTGNVPLKVSWELIQDSAFDVQGLVATKLGERIARKFAYDIVNGSGTGEPEGVLNKSAVEMFTSFAAPTFNELIAFVHSLDPAYRGDGCVWIMNDATLGTLRQITDANDRPLWEPQAQAGFLGMPGGTLLGYPVIVDQAMPNLGDDTKPIVFGNVRQGYVVRRVKDITLVVLTEQYAVNGQVGYMAWMRGDACIQDPNSYLVGEGQKD